MHFMYLLRILVSVDGIFNLVEQTTLENMGLNQLKEKTVGKPTKPA